MQCFSLLCFLYIVIIKTQNRKQYIENLTAKACKVSADSINVDEMHVDEDTANEYF